MKERSTRQRVDHWLKDLEVLAREDPGDITRLQKLAYLNAVHAASLKVTLSGQGQVWVQRPFSQVLEQLDQVNPAEKLMNEDVADGCIFASSDWLKYHPDSKRARAIVNQGLAAQLRHHLTFLVEMFSASPRSGR